jgi:5-methylcytosine-specific restriction endonuclease McrBC GTP-binding regulatory subunit McrB
MNNHNKNSVPLTHTAISSETEAEELCKLVEERLDAVETLIREETDRLAEARLRDAFTLYEKKNHLTESYHRDVLKLKNNAVALARFKPEGLDRLKAKQARFEAALDANLKVLQTLSKASEHLIRGLAHDVEAPQKLDTYSRNGTKQNAIQRPHAQPIMISRKS